jgi:hypothetical protein
VQRREGIMMGRQKFTAKGRQKFIAKALEKQNEG